MRSGDTSTRTMARAVASVRDERGWHEFERVVRPVERLAHAVVRELEREGEGQVDPDARKIQRAILAHVDAYATLWQVDETRLRAAIDLPDTELAPRFLRTVDKERKKALDAGHSSPDADPRWREVASAIQERVATHRALCKADLRALLKAAPALCVKAVSFYANGEPMGWIPRKRLAGEVKNLPDDAVWTINGQNWITTWKGGRGRLRFPLNTSPLPSWEGAVCIDWNVLVTSEPVPEPAPEPAPEPVPEPVPELPPELPPEPVPEPYSTPAMVADSLVEQLAQRKLNASLFGSYGQGAWVVLYTQAKPSHQVAKAKGADLKQALRNAMAQIADNYAPADNASEFF